MFFFHEVVAETIVRQFERHFTFIFIIFLFFHWIKCPGYCWVFFSIFLLDSLWQLCINTIHVCTLVCEFTWRPVEKKKAKKSLILPGASSLRHTREDLWWWWRKEWRHMAKLDVLLKKRVGVFATLTSIRSNLKRHASGGF